MGEVLKASVFEQVGIAVNASSLEMDPLAERALERVAALGAAAAEVAIGADIAGLTLAAMQVDVYRTSAPMADLLIDPGTPDVRDQVAGELGPMLLHIREGCQHGLVPSAVVLFARWLSHRRLFAGVDGPRLERFSTRVLHEWLSDKCIACGGSGKLERSRGGAWIRPRGSMQRNATFRPCMPCQGSGRAMASHGERARWLRLSMETYDAERWSQKFNAATTWLTTLIHGRMKRPLTNQLERRKKRI
jgi:hypothetical protein